MTDEKLLKHADSCTPAKDEIVKSLSKHEAYASNASTQLLKFASNTSATFSNLKGKELPQSQAEKLEPERIKTINPLA